MTPQLTIPVLTDGVALLHPGLKLWNNRGQDSPSSCSLQKSLYGCLHLLHMMIISFLTDGSSCPTIVILWLPKPPFYFHPRYHPPLVSLIIHFHTKRSVFRISVLHNLVHDGRVHFRSTTVILQGRYLLSGSFNSTLELFDLGRGKFFSIGLVRKR